MALKTGSNLVSFASIILLVTSNCLLKWNPFNLCSLFSLATGINGGEMPEGPEELGFKDLSKDQEKVVDDLDKK